MLCDDKKPTFTILQTFCPRWFVLVFVFVCVFVFIVFVAFVFVFESVSVFAFVCVFVVVIVHVLDFMHIVGAALGCHNRRVAAIGGLPQLSRLKTKCMNHYTLSGSESTRLILAYEE